MLCESRAFRNVSSTVPALAETGSASTINAMKHTCLIAATLLTCALVTMPPAYADPNDVFGTLSGGTCTCLRPQQIPQNVQQQQLLSGLQQGQASIQSH